MSKLYLRWSTRTVEAIFRALAVYQAARTGVEAKPMPTYTVPEPLADRGDEPGTARVTPSRSLRLVG
jgi:hypothetical protein